MWRLGSGTPRWPDRWAADSNVSRRARLALYLAARRLLSDPSMTTSPSVVRLENGQLVGHCTWIGQRDFHLCSVSPLGRRFKRDAQTD